LSDRLRRTTEARGRRFVPAGLLAGLVVFGAGRPTLAEPSSGTLRRAIDEVVSRRAFASAIWGIEVRDLRSGRVLYTHDAEKSLKPASTLKLVTSAAALDAFGPEARLRTTVETVGRLDLFGRIVGDVFLVGRGDPSLSGRYSEGRHLAAFESLADALRAAGVRRIEGRLVGHEGAFSGERRGSDWSWEDLVWSYGAEVSALSFNDNSARLRLLPGERPGDPGLLEEDPRSDHFSVVSTVLTAPASSKTDLTLTEPLPNQFRLTGAIAQGDRPWEGTVAISDPARYAARVFTDVLEAKGIRVVGGAATSSDPLPPLARELAGRDSPPLSELIKVVNKESQNLHAEILLRLLGQKATGEGTTAAGHAAVQQFLSRLGMRPEDFGLQDGSGLSRSDLLTAHGLVALMAAMDRHPHARAFRESLAEPGQKGTLENRLKAYQGRVFAKTGTLRQANALAGYATAADGDRLAFAIVLNNHTLSGREAVGAIDDIMGILLRR
jgi:D-alanyl-D-alanine carboxypeptidase/D-alanyl-D-alanine-endopeptidase (penicillin-binding protein 4)